MSFDIERSFLPHLLKPESLEQLLLDIGLQSEVFLDDDMRKTYEYCLHYFERSGFKEAPPRSLLLDEFPYLEREELWPEDEVVLSELIERLLKKFKREQVKHITREMNRVLFDDENEALNIGQAGLAQIRMDVTTRERSEPYAANFERRIEEYFERVDAPGNLAKRKSIFFGWPEVNEVLYGLFPPELAVVGALTGYGKSFALAKIALEAARNGTKTILYTMENSKELTLMRMDCIVTGLPFSPYMEGKMNFEQIQQLKNARDEIMSFGDNLIIDYPGKQKERTVYDLYTRAKFMGAKLVVGDQLSFLYTPEVFNDRVREMGAFIQEIVQLNHDMDVAAVWASQFNRSAAAQKKGGTIQNYAWSSEIEKYADFGFLMNRNDAMEDREQICFTLKKSRRTRDDVWWLLDWQFSDSTTMRVDREVGPDFLDHR